ncbi:hypothetical protein CI102_893 [Trichoderma harzianum]|nr:hypothetical protein CI102_893 [Trichoderma harzianum]
MPISACLYVHCTTCVLPYVQTIGCLIATIDTNWSIPPQWTSFLHIYGDRWSTSLHSLPRSALPRCCARENSKVVCTLRLVASALTIVGIISCKLR